MNLSYNALGYLVIFLPITMLLYQIVKQKYRWIVLLLANLVFFGVWSQWLVVYCLATTLITFFIGKKLGAMKKAPDGVDKKVFKKQKRRILTAGILLNFAVLLGLKYTNFFATGIFAVFQQSFTPLKIWFQLELVTIHYSLFRILRILIVERLNQYSATQSYCCLRHFFQHWWKALLLVSLRLVKL